MKKNLLKVLIVACVFLLQACVTTKITSNKEEGYTKKPKKIYVIAVSSKTAKKFFTDFTEEFGRLLKEKNVETSFFVKDELSLQTDDEINKMINAYNPEALMVIRQTVVKKTNALVTGGTFDISLIDSETQKPVWKSQFDVDAQMSMRDAAFSGANKLYKQLVLDNIIN